MASLTWPLAIGIAAFVVLLGYAVVGAVVARGERESAERTAERAGDRLERATGGILSVGRVGLISGTSIVVMFLSETAGLVGFLGGLLGDVPVLTSNLIAVGAFAAWVGGYLPAWLEADVLLAVVVLVAIVAIARRYA